MQQFLACTVPIYTCRVHLSHSRNTVEVHPSMSTPKPPGPVQCYARSIPLGQFPSAANAANLSHKHRKAFPETKNGLRYQDVAKVISAQIIDQGEAPCRSASEPQKWVQQCGASEAHAQRTQYRWTAVVVPELCNQITIDAASDLAVIVIQVLC
jgi:hypothetical protein